MSSGSNFILTMWEGKKASKKAFEKVFEKYSGKDEFSGRDKVAPAFVEQEIRGGYNYIEKTTRKILVPIVEWSFCSSFTVLKDYYNMNPYDKGSCYKVFTYEDVRLWKQAAQYTLEGKYSDRTELLLNNPYIQELKSEGYDMFDKKVPADVLYMREDLYWFYSIMTSCENILKSDLCDTYNDINKKEYKLLYLAW